MKNEVARKERLSKGMRTTIRGDKMRAILRFVLVIVVGLSGVGLWAWPPHGNNLNRKKYRADPINRILYEFWEQRKEGLRYHIWMRKRCFLISERIDILVEFHLGNDTSYFSFAFEGPSEEVRTGEGGRLLVKRDDWVVVLRRTNLPKLKVSDFLPPLDSVPTHWLHGVPVEPYRAKDDEPKPWGEVTLHSGESSVARIPNLIAYFKTKRGEFGRLFVEVYDYRKGCSMWLPIEGRYRVQYGTSNIIEFEIRQ